MIPRGGQPPDPHPLTLAMLAITAIGLAWLLARHREAFGVAER